jgi:hypothetical protein
MKSRIITVIQKYPLPSLVAAVLFGVVLLYVGAGLITSVRHAIEDAQVNSLEKKAEESQQRANQQGNSRRAEDLNREQTIAPERDRSRRDVVAARDRTRKAEIDYENARKNVPDSGGIDARALHERNCAELRELYPGESIPFCQN